MRNGWMKFMWPTWPTAGFKPEPPVSTRLPPCFPPSQRSPNRSRLSAKSFSTLTWRIGAPSLRVTSFIVFSLRRTPLAEELREFGGARCRGQLVAERALRKHLRQFRQQLQVQVGRLFGNEEHEHLRHRLAVGRVEGNGGLEPGVGPARFGQA